MAYIGQDKKKEIAALLKPILKQYGVKGTLSVQNSSTIVFTIASGKIDFFKDWLGHQDGSNYFDVNPYWYSKYFEGKSLKFLTEAFKILNTGNWNNSRSEIDYFDVGWYVNVRVGKWNKPYVLEK